MRIALVVSETENLPEKVKTVNPATPNQMRKTTKSITRALESNGHEVFLVEANTKMLENIMNIGDVDLIFCHYMPMLDMNNQGNVFAALELLGIPMVGSGMYAQAVTLSKENTKLLLKSRGIATAAFQVFETGEEELNEDMKNRFPLFVKPESESQSVGVLDCSLVHNEEELRKSMKHLLSIVKPPLIVEEYLDGREFTVGVLDGDPPIALPVFEFLYGEHDEIKFQTVERKGNNDIEKRCPAHISDELKDEMQKIALEAFKAVRAKVYLRVDFRLDKNGKPNVLEVNIMPGLQEDKSFYNLSAKEAGISYDELINRMAEVAYKKYPVKKDFEIGRF